MLQRLTSRLEDLYGAQSNQPDRERGLARHLLAISLILNEGPHALPDTLPAATVALREAFDLAALRLFSVEENPARLERLAHAGDWGQQASQTALPLDDSTAPGRVASSGSPARSETSDGHTITTLPLIVNAQVVGVLEARSAFAPALAEVVALQTAANYIALSVERHQKIERIQSALDEYTTLYSTVLALNAAETLSEVFSTALTEIARFSGADRIVTYIAGPDPWQAVEYVEPLFVWEDGSFQAVEQPAHQPLSDTPVLAQFPQSRASMRFNDVASAPQLPEPVRQAYAERGVDALLMLPLTTGATWLGALLLEKHNGQTFSDKQQQLSRSLADQAALAADFQVLLSQSQRSARRERELRAVSDAIRDATNPDEILRIADEKLEEMLHVPLATIQQARAGEADLLRPDEWQLVQTVDRQAQLAIANMRLLAQTEQSVRQEQVVGEVTADLQRAVSVDDVLQTTVESLQTTLTDYNVRLRLTPPTGGGAADVEQGGESA